MNAVEQLTQCWNCGLSYVIGAEQCPGCGRTTADSSEAKRKTMGGKSVMQVLAATDDHLQSLRHYGHSNDLREAMSAVQELLDAVAPLFNRNATIYANEITLPMASHAEAMRSLRAVRAAIAKVGAA